ncbi:hypothetical protein EI534_14635 [Pseudomonas frederiksbergensis]|nr:hypothetical protein [Pseudomonas frederiksbergensis]
MDVEEIEFSDWQIEKLRSALRRYRTISKHNGRMPSWCQVCGLITSSISNQEKYDEDDSELAFKPEALRRFAEGISKALSKDRMQDVARFLLDENLISPEVFQEERQDLAAFLAMHEYFANDYEGVPDLVSPFSGVFTYRAAGVSDADGGKTISLHLTPDASGKFVRVEEIVQLELNPARRIPVMRSSRRHQFKANEFVKKICRKGFGFPVTRLKILHIFLDGVTPGDRMTYTQAGELHGEYATDGFFLMRNGEVTGRGQWARDIYYDEPVTLPNICRFIPDRAQEK